MLSRWAAARTSLNRLNKFLRLPELATKPMVMSQDDSKEYSIRVTNGEFEWEAPHDDDEDINEADNKPEEEKSKSGTEEFVLLDSVEERDTESATDIRPTFRPHDINVEVRNGELIAIIGRVGSGKTSLLNSMLGEMKLLSGNLEHQENLAISYVCQRLDSSLQRSS